MKNTSTRLIASIIALVAVVGGIFAYALRGGSSSQPATGTLPTTATTDATTTAADTTGKYKDGTYQATGSYMSPEGSESVAVSITLKDGVVTDATVQGVNPGPVSRGYQNQFINGYKAQVIGKSIDSINLDKVSGSSLTPGGFDNALTQIKAEAQA